MKIKSIAVLAASALLCAAPAAAYAADLQPMAGSSEVTVSSVADLKDAGLLDTKSGRGRNTLARSAESVTLWDIFCAVEGGETEGLFKLHQHTSETCVVGSNIRSLLLPHLDDTVKAARAELEKVSLADLVAELRAVQEAEK